MKKHRILIIDDEPHILEALDRTFRKTYEVLLANNATEAYTALQSGKKIHLIICDQRMPDASGTEVLEKSIKLSPHSMRMLLTGYADIEAVIDAVNKGKIYKYLAKPWETPQIKIEVRKALEVYELEKTIFIQNEKLQVLDKAKNDFLMLISHELKTPLTTILSFSDFLKTGGEHSKEEKDLFLTRIQEGAEKLQDLIDDTLGLITAQVGKLTLKKTQIALERVVEEARVAVHEKALKKKIILDEFELGSTQTKVDIPLMKRAFEKLIDFAIAASDEHGKITMVVKSQDKIEIKLNYKGHVLTQEQQGKIFQPFLVVGDILTHKLGAGLALPICKTIIEAHGGDIVVSSSQAHGTTFTISL